MTPEQWKRIEEIYLAALDLPGAERVALLCQAPPEIRAQVEAMLAQPSGSQLLDASAGVSCSEVEPPSPIVPGAQIGQYSIEGTIGAGGMGVVFRAYDTRIQRPVAIKFLSDEVADPTARRRFQREAQMASSLNHPHILTVYDVGEFEGRQYLVTEFVDGGTLKNWVEREARTWEHVVELLTGVADALATAHQAGILHRDVKPDNILVTASGYAKLADFGLAKLEEAPPQSSATLTLTQAQTRQGMIIGTIAYMSPEQASGKPIDARSDVFSFGVVLYEMLSGHRPFRAASNLELLQRVIHANPSPLDADIPEPLRALVMKTLEKDPAKRPASMREVVTALRSSRRNNSHTTPASWPGRTRSAAVIAVAAVVAVAVIAGAYFFSRRGAPLQRLSYTPLTNFTDSATGPALSPDGRMLAFVRGDSTFIGPGDVYVKLLPDGDPVQLTHDGAAKMVPVSFSPDGSRIAYTKGVWETWTVPVLGGEPTRLLADTEGLSWTNSNPPRVMFSAGTGEGMHMGIFTSTESRSEQRTVYLAPNVDAMAHRSFLSPDGKWVIVVNMGVDGWQPCRVVPFDGSSAGREAGPASAQCTFAGWTPDSKWMYFSANTGDGFHIWRQRFPDGKPEQVTSGATEENGVSFFPNGKSFVTSVGDSMSALWVHDPKGDRQITFEGYAYLPSFSRDTSRLYYLQRSQAVDRFVNGELWTENLESGKKQRVLPDFLMAHYDVSPDGKEVVFVGSSAPGPTALWIAPTDGSAAPRKRVDQDCTRALFAPDGEIFFSGGPAGNQYIQAIQPDGTGLRRVIPEKAPFLYDISPDGKWLAAWVDAGTDIKIYSTSGGDPMLVCQHCASGGAEERGTTPSIVSWSQDGGELYLYSEHSQGTYVLPLPPGDERPAIPPSGIQWIDAPPPIPNVRTISTPRAFMSGHPGVYAYLRVSAHRNIYRIPVP